ncbi:unconventional myosin-X-like isoform X2 [Hydractinia symbiolongicarpus]|uniref:unconventional myosin-X-like isoform X2 n=1 Tax=Hydractinia symbiolongicarpus TaxID=13093 RepID=UPI00254F17D3|nr:unconventional myosin-X-like isoform X2 [Hydractinia symbiolongicarpus]
MDNTFVVGTKVWLLVEDDWQAAVVTENKNGQITFTAETGKKHDFPFTSINRQVAAPMHQSSIDGVEDMAKLGDMHEAAILYNLNQRYQNSQIYTHIGSILVAVNPYKIISGLYENDVINSYNNKYLGDMPPHIYAIANEAYYAMWRKGGNQCVLISGESGAGKTESTKHILRFLSEMSRYSLEKQNSVVEGVKVEEAILQSSPILEAFGNAKTVYNNNSSRFGKYMELSFSNSGNINGGVIVDYLLEKNRVVRQNPNERNFHIFYALCAGTPTESRALYHLYPPEKYYYLSQSGCISDASINDVQDYQNVVNAMEILGLSTEQIQNVMLVLSSILQLGNIEFMTTGGAQVEDKNVLENLSNLLQVDLYDLNDALTQKSMVLRGEKIMSPLTVEQAVDSRDSVAMALYQACFKWLIHKINNRLRGCKDFFSVGVLDIFGFENFKINRFEQFNINFANEKLQEYFNKHIFSLEQLEYNREGLEWTDIDWNDNGECLDLVEKKLGLLSLIDEESHFPKGTDESLLRKLHENHAANPFYIKPRVADTRFGIRHYAGEVFYESNGFLEKNRDTFREDLLSVLTESRSDFIYDMFDTMKKAEEATATAAANVKRAKKPKKATVSSQFKSSLFSLMSTLNNANPYFVRCIKPNGAKVKESFESDLVLSQLKYSGMLETVKIRKAGFPVRRTYEDFMQRYKALFYKAKQKMLVDAKDNCVVILTQFDPRRDLHRSGKTKIFLKDKLEAEIEIHRTKNIKLAGRVILNQIFGFLIRKKFVKTKLAIVLIQKMYKGHFYKTKFIQKKNAAVMLQRYERGRQARKLYADMLEQKRIEEERRKEEERRREEEKRKELERLEQERKTKELEELRKKIEEEERLKREQEEEQRVKEELQRQAEIAKLRELEEQIRIEDERKRLEEEARLKAEEEQRIKEEEEARLNKEEDELKKQEEEERLDREATEDALREMAELDAQLQFEEAMDDDEDFDDDNVSRIISFGEDMAISDRATMEGYLSLKGGLMNTAKRHWCVLKDDTLMWFRGRQKALKSGWLMKKGGGTGTLSRRNWKRRWFVLKDTLLTYHDSDQDGAKTLGTIDLRSCRQIVDSSQKDNALSIIMPERTYHFTTESPQDWNDWFSILNRVHRANELELKEMKEESANIRNAVGTIDTIVIESISVDVYEDRPKHRPNETGSQYLSAYSLDSYDSISRVMNDGKRKMSTGSIRGRGTLKSRQNGFSIITANRVYSFTADKVGEVEQWAEALNQSKEKQFEEGTTIAIEKGWLLKKAPTDQGRDKRRWFILNSNSLDYFKSTDKNSPKLGSIVLNSLCTIIPPPPADDAKAKETGQWEFVVNGRKRSYNLITSSSEDAVRWHTAIQEVIDNKVTVETPYQKLISDVMDANSEAVIGRIYRVHPLLNCTKQPIKMPLLPLPYGHSLSQRAQNKDYGTFYEEALRIFISLQELENVADPIAVTQGILQTCHDMKELRDEIYCQLIKQTTGLEDPNSLSGLRHMQVLVCMCCTFLPSRKILRFLRFHLKRLRDQCPDTEISKFGDFALDALKRTRVREFPPSREEIITLLGRRKITATVYCYGGGSCQITIDSSTTSGEVVKTLCKGMKIKQTNLIFALFERCGPSNEKSIEDRQIITDVLAKFERYKAIDVNKTKRHKWQLFFKIFCFLHPERVSEDSIAGNFLFEQTCENVLRGRYLLPELTLCKLAALRLQYNEGDYIVGTWIDKEIRTVFPVAKIRKKAAQENKPAPKKDYGTIRGTIRKAISPFKAEEEMSEQPKYDVEEELSAIKSNVMSKWKELQGTPPDDAQVEYMSIVKNWHGFGSTMFNVTSKDPTMIPELSLGVSFNNVAIYRRDETRPIATYNYEDILSFGAPQPNVYRIVVQGRSPITFETEKVVEIAKLMKAYINEIVKSARRKSAALRQSLQLIGDDDNLTSPEPMLSPDSQSSNTSSDSLM